MSETTTSQKTKLRIENLSDLVFGLALSIGSIILISKIPQTPGDLVSSIVLFAFSFLIIIWIWSGYTRTMALLPFEVQGTFLLNVTLLFCVATEPYLFYVLQQAPFSLLAFSSSLYAVDAGAMMLILSGLAYLVLIEDRKRQSHASLFRLRRSMYAGVASGAMFLASALPFFWVPVSFGAYLRFDVWYCTFAVFFVVLRAGRES